MWLTKFEERLVSWRQLRITAESLPIEQALQLVNDWWFHAPWKPYYLHWDDIDNWPNPWDLLADNCYCDLARALGIVYTLLMIDSISSHSIEIVETDETNLVLVDDGKYILNWDLGEVLNNRSTPIQQSLHRAIGDRFHHLLR